MSRSWLRLGWGSCECQQAESEITCWRSWLKELRIGGGVVAYDNISGACAGVVYLAVTCGDGFYPELYLVVANTACLGARGGDSSGMALQLRPTCEHCNTPLPPDSLAAMICSFECTFCRTCVERVLENVCPNCGGGFCSRPIRPKTNWRDNNYLGARPAATVVTCSPVDKAAHAVFAARIKGLVPEER